jgi:putative ABC transport system substrate-binding protein
MLKTVYSHSMGSDLPFEVPTRYELIVNLKSAKAMGLNISDSFLLLADEIIE